MRSDDIRVHNLILIAAVVVQELVLVAVVAQAVPLGAGLRVKGENVVVDSLGRLVVDLVGERLAFETGRRHDVQRPVGRDSGAVCDFLGGAGDDLGREHVDGAELIVIAVKTPRVASGAVFAQRQGIKGRSCCHCENGRTSAMKCVDATGKMSNWMALALSL